MLASVFFQSTSTPNDLLSLALSLGAMLGITDALSAFLLASIALGGAFLIIDVIRGGRVGGGQ